MGIVAPGEKKECLRIFVPGKEVTRSLFFPSLKHKHHEEFLYIRPPKIKAYISLYSVRELSYGQNKIYPGEHSLPSCNSTFISAVLTKRGAGTG